MEDRSNSMKTRFSTCIGNGASKQTAKRILKKSNPKFI